MADRRYETLVLIHPDQGEPGSQEMAGRIRALIDEQGGTVAQVQEWGSRELALRAQDYRAILQHYYPGARLRRLSGAAAALGGGK